MVHSCVKIIIYVNSATKNLDRQTRMLVNMRVAWRPPSVKGGAPRIRFAVTARGTANVRRATTLFDNRKQSQGKSKRRSSFTSGQSIPPRQTPGGVAVARSACNTFI